MTRPKFTLLTVVLLLFIVSAACSGFLAGRTIKLHEEGKLQEMRQVSEQIIDAHTAIDRAVTVVKRVILR
ncbi:hypothetical protein CLV84_4112 [Neolewinella xylanilytica]|uniref:Uncharacterized protein n=1 Tax=Neolewinella xylanilytica TaxID=1514080 RepID=A0A2S6I0F3_9BACT|nr:hypothetical protein [Neolewinella xylanilytica]PPK84342.1 hypothetical protein CLV84_4112 [Neolewinella xylanilytica]